MTSKRRRRRGKFSDYIATFTLFAIIAIGAAWLEHWSAEEVVGTMVVVDGDSLKAGERRLRLVGIDAPEYNQLCKRRGTDYPCGRAARDHLRSLIDKGSGLSCKSEGRDKYDRLLVECFAGDVNLNSAMVAAGWAISYGGYHRQEAKARTDKVGLWAGDFQRPDDWRARHSGLIESEHNAMLRGLWRRVRGWLFEGNE